MFPALVNQLHKLYNFNDIHVHCIAESTVFKQLIDISAESLVNSVINKAMDELIIKNILKNWDLKDFLKRVH